MCGGQRLSHPRSGRGLRRTPRLHQKRAEKSPLAQSLGCEIDETGSVVSERHAATAVPGLYFAGNVRGEVHLAIMAAAEGAEAAIAMNEQLGATGKRS